MVMAKKIVFEIIADSDCTTLKKWKKIVFRKVCVCVRAHLHQNQKVLRTLHFRAVCKTVSYTHLIMTAGYVKNELASLYRLRLVRVLVNVFKHTKTKHLYGICVFSTKYITQCMPIRHAVERVNIIMCTYK